MHIVSKHKVLGVGAGESGTWGALGAREAGSYGEVGGYRRMGIHLRNGKHVIKPWLPLRRGQDWSKEQLEGGGVGVGWGGAVVLWELFG